MTEDEIQQASPLVVAAAIASAGPMGDNLFSWKTRVMQGIGEAGALIRAGSDAADLAGKVLAADVFRAVYIGFEEEYGKTEGKASDKPTRIIIKTQSDMAIKNNPGKDDHNPEGFEYTRSEPLWTAAGRHTRARLEKIEPGTPILVYKYTEQIGQNKKVRVLVHFDVLGRPQSSPPSQTQASPTPPQSATPPVDEATPSQASPPVAHSQEDNAGLSQIERTFDTLTSRQRVAFGKSCRAENISDFMCPAPADMDRVLALLNKALEA